MHAFYVATAADQHLERPDCPEGNECDKTIVLANYAHLLPLFESNVVAKKTAGVRLQVIPLRGKFLGGSFWN
jgi:hypothetical protein